MHSPGFPQIADYILRPMQSGDMFFDLVGTMDEKRIIAIARQLIYRVPANSTGLEMRQNFQLLVQSQLLVEQLNQLLKVACIHSASQ
jgi:hypothetical protein